MAQAVAPGLDTQASSKKNITMALVAVFTVYTAAFAVTNLQTAALPQIAADLDGMALYSWAVAAPSLAAAFVTLIFGKLSDLFGRRIIILVALALYFAGGVLSASAPTFMMFIVGRSVLALGQGAMAPLCFSVLGDLFSPAERGKWAGLLNIPSGILALVGPTLGGYIVDNWTWRYIFWGELPLLVLAAVFVAIGIPKLASQKKHKIDYTGAILLAFASSTMLLGFSWAGSTYPWASPQVLGLLGASVVFWAIFLFVESKAEEPMLDPQMLTNRTFITASVAGLLSLFGFMALLVYFPLFNQAVQGLSASTSGQIATPFQVLMRFGGVLAGFAIARTKKYKWMYLVGYAIMVGASVLLWTMTAQSSVLMAYVVSLVMGLGLGTIPTVNTLVVQYAVPKRLLGVATGGIYFFVMIGAAIAPAILGSTMNSVYAKQLQSNLPAELSESVDAEVLASLNNPRVLLSAPAVAALEESFAGNDVLLEQTIDGVRASLEAGLKSAFLIGVVTMVASFLLIITIPTIDIEADVADKKEAPAPEKKAQAAD